MTCKKAADVILNVLRLGRIKTVHSPFMWAFSFVGHVSNNMHAHMHMLILQAFENSSLSSIGVWFYTTILFGFSAVLPALAFSTMIL